MWALLQTANFKLFLWITLIKRHICNICTFFSKENSFVLHSLLKDWNYFWNKHCNLVSRISPFDIFCVILTSKAKIALWASWQNRKKILWTKRHKIQSHKITCQIKQGPNFLFFSFFIEYYMSIFSLFL